MFADRPIAVLASYAAAKVVLRYNSVKGRALNCKDIRHVGIAWHIATSSTMIVYERIWRKYAS